MRSDVRKRGYRFSVRHRDQGKRVQRAGTTFATRSTRSASRSAASSTPADLAPAAIAGSLPGSAARQAISSASRSGVKSSWLEHDRAAGLRQHVGIGELVLVERVRQRNQDRRPPDRRKLGDRRGAGARHDQMRRRDARRQVGEERRDLGFDAEPRIGLARRAVSSSPRACCTMSSRARRSGAIFSIAGGTISAITRAPWLPPDTSRRNGPTPSGAVIGLRRRRDHHRPHRIAGERRLGGERRVERHVGKAGRDRASRAAPAACWRAPSRHWRRGSRSGCAAASRRAPAAGSDSRRNRPPRPAGSGASGAAPSWRRRRASPTVFANEIGSRPRIVALGITCVSRAGKSWP